MRRGIGVKRSWGRHITFGFYNVYYHFWIAEGCTARCKAPKCTTPPLDSIFLYAAAGIGLWLPPTGVRILGIWISPSSLTLRTRLTVTDHAFIFPPRDRIMHSCFQRMIYSTQNITASGKNLYALTFSYVAYYH